MAFSRGEIVEVKFRLPPDGRLEEHPVLIISNSELNKSEEGFTAVMMSTTNADDEYSFNITDNMLNIPYGDNKHREIRLNLIGSFIDKDVVLNTRKRMYVKEDHLKRIITQINRITFGFEIKV